MKFRNMIIKKLVFFTQKKKIDMFELLKTSFLSFVVQIKGRCALYRIEETKLVCAISRKCVFG